jgi:hypothetical protein
VVGHTRKQRFERLGLLGRELPDDIHDFTPGREPKVLKELFARVGKLKPGQAAVSPVDYPSHVALLLWTIDQGHDRAWSHFQPCRQVPPTQPASSSELTQRPHLGGRDVAFSSSLADWSGAGDSEERWRARLTPVQFNLAAYLGGTEAGMISGVEFGDGAAELLSM